jgi:predicted dehydrogenase
LRYPDLRVVLHASALTASVAPRFVVHGTAGSYTKHGLDTQEDALKAGRTPGDTDWGRDPLPGQLTLRQGSGVIQQTVEPLAGNYLPYYEGVRDAILQGNPLPVTASEARDVIRLIELGLQSHASGCWVSAT